MGVNVAFDIADNTDDIEPTVAFMKNPKPRLDIAKKTKVAKRISNDSLNNREPV
jgi:hypothetical protein